MSFFRAVWSLSAPFVIGGFACFVVLVTATVLVKLFNAWTKLIGVS